MNVLLYRCREFLITANFPALLPAFCGASATRARRNCLIDDEETWHARWRQLSVEMGIGAQLAAPEPRGDHPARLSGIAIQVGIASAPSHALGDARFDEVNRIRERSASRATNRLPTCLSCIGTGARLGRSVGTFARCLEGGVFAR